MSDGIEIEITVELTATELIILREAVNDYRERNTDNSEEFILGVIYDKLCN